MAKKLNKADLLTYLLARANSFQDRADRAEAVGAKQLVTELRTVRYELLDAWSAGTGGDYADAVIAAANLGRS